MTLDEVKKRFVDEVKLRAYDDKYIDRKEEKEILQIALTAQISFESALSALQQVCEAQDYVLESKVLAKLKDILDTSAGNDGQIDEKEYRDAVINCKKWTNNKKNDVECKRMVLGIIQDASYKTSKGWFSSWYDAARKEAGL